MHAYFESRASNCLWIQSRRFCLLNICRNECFIKKCWCYWCGHWSNKWNPEMSWESFFAPTGNKREKTWRKITGWINCSWVIVWERTAYNNSCACDHYCWSQWRKGWWVLFISDWQSDNYKEKWRWKWAKTCAINIGIRVQISCEDTARILG